MNKNWILGAVLVLGACGGEDSDTGAALLGNNGELTEVKTIDLTADGRTYVVNVRENGGVSGDVTVNSRTGTYQLDTWVDRVAVSHGRGTLTSDDGAFIVLTNIYEVAEDLTPEDLAREAREQAHSQANCPEECIHCPEDNVFLCQSMCGAR